MEQRTSPDGLITRWLTLPDVAEALGIEVGKVRRIVQERRVVGMARGKPRTYQIPADFLVPAHLADPANPVRPTPSAGRVGEAADAAADEPGDRPASAVLSTLHGTITVLTDLKLTDEEILVWLFEPSPDLGERPIDSLLAGRKARVRQAAQALG